MPVSCSLTRNALIAASLCMALAACDRQGGESAQGQGALAGKKQSLSGKIDRSQAGALMPALELRDPAGQTLNTSALQGKPVLVNLWATWCAPCVVEMPMLDDLADNLGGDMRVLTVSQDLQGAEKVEPFFAKMKFRNLQPWLDPDNALGFAVGGGVLPTTVLYDAQGQEVWRVVGEYDWSTAEAEEAIRAELSE